MSKDKETALKRAAIEKLMAEKSKKNKPNDAESEDRSSDRSDSSDSSDSSSEDDKNDSKYIKKLKVIHKKLEKTERKLEKYEKDLKNEKKNSAQLTKFASAQTDTIYKLESKTKGCKSMDNLIKNTEDRTERVIIKKTDYLKKNSTIGWMSSDLQ